MSAKSSAKKAAVFNEANELLYDAFQAVQLPDYFSVDPPWPEWNDAEINAETWGNGNKIRGQTSKSVGKSEITLDTVSYYFDSEPGILPPDLQRHIVKWKRPHEVFPPDSLTLYDGSNPDFSLKTCSENSSNCELFKAISDVCTLLRFYASMEPFPVECQTPFYTSNTKGQPWQPWHHIYGNCKAGKDQPHRPMYYPYGKYILRLFYLGAWRKFIVDDQIPCDGNGKSLLPVTSRTGEIWPIILVKGILKISSLALTSRMSAMDLPLWTVFTGWILNSFSMLDKSPDQKWRLIHAMNPEFTLPEKSEKGESRQNVASTSSKGTAKRVNENKENKKEEGRPVLTIAKLGNFPPDSKLAGETYQVVVIMTRDIPLTKYKVRKPTEPWKRIRWVHWAANKGLWTDEQLILPYRCLHQINFVKELYELTCIDREAENRLFITGEDSNEPTSPEETFCGPLQWIDYYKFMKYLNNLSLLVKPSVMTSKYKMTYINLGLPSNTAGGNVKIKTMSTNTETYHMLPTVKVSGNEPPILYLESDTGIFISFSLWVYPREPVDSVHYLSCDQPELLRVYHGSLIVEKYDWRLTRQNAIVAAVKTVGNGTTCIFLNPGRHALRMWLDTDSPFVIDLCSNTELIVGKGPKIRFNMSTESIRITEYLNRASTGFIDLVQKYGRRDHAKNLSQFYALIKPRNSIKLNYHQKMNFFLEAFSLGIYKVLKTIVQNEDELRWMAKGLKSIFMNPYIPCPISKLKPGGSVISQKKTRFTAVPGERRERTLSDFLNRDWTDEEIEKITMIQRIFRGYRIRQLLRYQSPNSKEHKTVTEALKKICELMFAPNKRDIEAARLIRETITVKQDLLETFVFHRDIGNVIVTEEFTGKITGVEPKAWVPMIRFIFVCHSEDPLPCAFYHSCNLEQYTVAVTDNDTNEEIFRLVNSTCPHYYHRNQRGYTLFVYGWNESDPKTVNWRLEMVKMKHFLEIHPCNSTLIGITGNQCHPYQPLPLSVQEIRNFYIPNKQNKICTCLIKVRKRILVTIRLAMSFEDAHFYTRIYLRSNNAFSDSESSVEGEDLVTEAEANSSAIIFPSVLLDHHQMGSRITMDSKEEQNDQTVYALEAFVAHNSWPLTKHEWGVVEPIRVNGETWPESLSLLSVSQSRKSSTGSRRNRLRSSKTGLASQKTVESPYWCLQVVTDFSPDLNTIVEVTEDKSYREMIKNMKVTWEENDPGRRQRGKTMQKDFLKQVYDEMIESRKTNPHSEFDINQAELLESFLSKSSYDSLLSNNGSFEALLHEMRSFSYLLNDKTESRYLKTPRILPWTPLNDLIAKYSRGKSETEEISSTESSRNQLGEDYVIPKMQRKPLEILQEERKKLLNGMKKRRMILEDHFMKENNLSKRLMEQAYEERRRFIEKKKAVQDKLRSAVRKSK